VDTVNIMGSRVVAVRHTAMSRSIANVVAGSDTPSPLVTTTPELAAVRLIEAPGKGSALSGDALRLARSASPGWSSTSRICKPKPRRWRNALPK
jgi:hypothetical protein